jgi:succinylglutamate desuccinylase
MKILINALTHGDELIGLRVIKEIKKHNLSRNVHFNIANKRAYKLNKRFIDQDLNRSFPGNLKGNYEQRLAAKLFENIKSFDVVMDIHSTKSMLKDSLIVTKLNKKTLEYVKAIGPKYLLHMKATKNNALISSAKIGIAFEYGKDDSGKAIANTVEGIERLLAYFKMININFPTKHINTKIFSVNKTIKKPYGALAQNSVKNFKLVKKGETYAYTGTGEKLSAKESFYPILFGQSNYEDIFGFQGKLVSRKIAYKK